MLTAFKEETLRKRHLRVRKKVSGTSERPRLSLHRSHLNLFVQLIDDVRERTLFSSSTLHPRVRGKEKKQWGNIEGARKFSAFLAGELKKNNITHVVFDRGGRPYRGRIRAFAEALREHGIQF